MGLFNILICISALFISGISFLILVTRYFRKGDNVSRTDSAENVYAAYPPRPLEFSLPVNSEGCAYLEKTGVISGVFLEEEPATYVLNFGICYIFTESVEDSGVELNAPEGTDIGAIILAYFPTGTKLGMQYSPTVNQFIQLDGSGDLVSTISELNLRTGAVYKFTYLGLVNGFGTVGVQVASQIEPNLLL